MSANLHELTKQLDVLTWNSRSVLNALIRSVMAASSSDGFTVNRANTPIVLSHEDIYLIADFYEEWEATGFDTGDNGEKFYELIEKVEQKHAETNKPAGATVWSALVKHAKIMWMNSDNSNSEDQYWLDKIWSVENPKWFTNTAPIPVSIRTPIYDENLSTKTFDEYDSYLFPSGYYSMDTLGYKGDGNTHTAGGESWLYDIDRVFTVHADRVLLGDQDTDSYNRHASTYYANSAYSTSPLYSLEGGHNSFAYGNYSVAYGINNHAVGATSVSLGGANNYVMHGYSAAVGGLYNDIADTYCFATGTRNSVVSSVSFAANSNNHTGGYSYDFTRSINGSWDSIDTECAPVQDIGGCHYVLDRKDSAVTTDEFSLGPNQIFVTDTDITLSGIGYGNRISSGWKGGATSIFDFKVGDTVRLYAFYVKTGNSVYQKATAPVTTRVVSIDDVKNKSGSRIGVKVTLDTELTSANIYGLGNNSVYAGKICRVVAVNYPKLFDRTTTLAKDRDISMDTEGASVFGYNNISAGSYQTVLGTSNRELLRPRFIVGSGSSYIYEGGQLQGDYHRSNALVVSPTYSYMSVTRNSYIISGISAYTTSYLHGDPDWSTNQVYDEDYISDNVEKYEGVYSYSLDPKKNDDTKALMRVFHQHSAFAIGWTGLHIYEPFTDYNGQTKTVWAELCSDRGGIALHTGSFLEDGPQDADNNWLDFYNNWTRASTHPGYDRSITIWAKDYAGIHGSNVYIHASRPSGYIILDGGNIRINASTNKALAVQPTDDGVEPHKLNARRIDTITDSGFMYADKTNNTMWSVFVDPYKKAQSNPYFGSYHVISSSIKTGSATGENIYDLAQIVLPGKMSSSYYNSTLKGSDSNPHPLVLVSEVHHVPSDPSSTYTNTNVLCEELAYLSDIKSDIRTSVITGKNGGVLGYRYSNGAPPTGMTPDAAGVDPNPDYPNAVGYWKLDPYLYSLLAADTDYSKKDAVAPTSTTPYATILIRPTSLPNAAGKVSNINQLIGSYYLDGVAVNPWMFMCSRKAGVMNGISYLAYGDGNVFGSGVYYSYTHNLANTTTGTYTSLHTSKFSPGSMTERTDLRTIYMMTLNSNHVVSWQPVFENVIMLYSNGRLRFEFAMHTDILKGYSALPVSYSYNVPHAAPASSAVDFDDCDTFEFYIPIDPIIGTRIREVYNNVGVNSAFHGRLEYTGGNTVYVTGRLYNGIATPAVNYANTTYPSYQEMTNITMLQIGMAWTGDAWLGSPHSTIYSGYIEGVVDYAQ